MESSASRESREEERQRPVDDTVLRSPATEAAVIAAWFAHAGFQRAWAPDPALFADPVHGRLATAMAALPEGARDQAGLVAELDRRGTLADVGGTQGVFRVLALTPDVADPWGHVRVLEEYRALRALLLGLDQAQRIGRETADLTRTVQAAHAALRSGTDALGVAVQTVRDLLRESARVAHLEPEVLAWCPSGIGDFEGRTGGLRPGTVAVCGAPTSWGKSSLAVMWADASLAAGRRAVLVTWEDAPDLYGRRLLARRARVNAFRLRERCLHPDERERIAETAARGEPLPFLLDARGRAVENVATDIRALCAGDAIDLVIVDYLQAASTRVTKQDRRNEITYIARTCTDAIKASNAAGLLFSQLRRLQSGKEKASRHALKESGDLENAAEIVLIGSFDNKPRRHRVNVEKAKDGGCGAFWLDWDGSACCFTGGRAIDEQDDSDADAYRWGAA